MHYGSQTHDDGEIRNYYVFDNIFYSPYRWYRVILSDGSENEFRTLKEVDDFTNTLQGEITVLGIPWDSQKDNVKINY